MKQTTQQLLKLLQELNPDITYEGRTDLFTSGDLDSISIVMLVPELNDTFDIEIKVTDIIPENFNSMEGMLSMIQRLQNEAE